MKASARAFEHGLAGRHRQPAHDAAGMGRDHMLHLHRFHHEKRLAGMDGIAGLHRQRDDGALQRRRAACVVPSGASASFGGHGFEIGARPDPARPADRRRQSWRRRVCARWRRRRRTGCWWSPSFGSSSAMCSSTKPVCSRARRQRRVAQQGLQEGDIGRHAGDLEFAQRAIGLGRGIDHMVSRRMHDQLGQQGIEARAGLIAGIAEAVDAHAQPGRRLIGAKGCRRPAWPCRRRPWSPY